MSRSFHLVLLAMILAASPSPQTMRQASEVNGIMVGAAVRPYLFNEAAYAETLGREFNMVEAEDAMKWWTIRKNQEAFDFRDGDAVIRFAEAHGMKVRGHCLVWDHNNPDWLAHGHFTTDQMSALLQEHISTVMKHFAGRVFAWDVVNEGLDEQGWPKDSPWYNQPGIGLAGKSTAYIEQAFRWARESDPKALLFYNDNGGEGPNRKSDAVYEMVKDFRRRGVPIDGVGLQMHIEKLDFDANAVAANITRLARLGILVHITELDVSLPLAADGQASAENLQRQAEVYRGVVRACLKNPGCTAIQTWGFTDKYSWIGSHSHGARGAALPFDRGYRPKPAYDAILQELKSKRSNAE